MRSHTAGAVGVERTRSAAEGVKTGTMESSGSDEQVPYSCRAEEKDCDLGHLPPLLEDEVSGSRFDGIGWGRVLPIQLDPNIMD